MAVHIALRSALTASEEFEAFLQAVLPLFFLVAGWALSIFEHHQPRLKHMFMINPSTLST
jgi:hypothetical protein